MHNYKMCVQLKSVGLDKDWPMILVSLIPALALKSNDISLHVDLIGLHFLLTISENSLVIYLQSPLVWMLFQECCQMSCPGYETRTG